MTEPILVADGLTRTFAEAPDLLARLRRRPQDGHVRPALYDVSLSLGVGEVLGVVGESGSGKSTLAKCLTLLERPDAGRVWFNGQDLTALRGTELRTARRHIQVVFQDPYSSLNPRFSVASQIGEVLRVHRLVPPAAVDSRVRELLDQVGLPASARDRYPADFSGGQRQRICIARALAAEPAVLIADEAVSALDVSIQAQILNLLLDLQERLGLAMVFISHNLLVVRHVAPRIAVMFGGRIVELLSAEVPLATARHPYTQALVAAIPQLGEWHPEPDAVGPADLATALPTIGCPFRSRCPLRFDPCETNDPSLLPLIGQHRVACHYVERARSGRTT
jgi:oligopeptide/dipeptide ABC transporter ATP-binding protein